LCYQYTQAEISGIGDSLQVIPENIFQRNTGLMAGYDDGMLFQYIVMAGQIGAFLVSLA